MIIFQGHKFNFEQFSFFQKIRSTRSCGTECTSVRHTLFQYYRFANRKINMHLKGMNKLLLHLP